MSGSMTRTREHELPAVDAAPVARQVEHALIDSVPGAILGARVTATDPG
jgi:hypothetical protein